MKRASQPVDGLIRFVLAPDGQVTPDLRRKLPGRGVWVTAEAAAVREAVKRRAFARGFRGPALAAPDLDAQIDRLMEADCLQSLSMANKAGLVITGFVKVEAALARPGAAAFRIEAGDGKADGRRKLDRAAGAAGIPVIDAFGNDRLSLALGRENVIHAVLLAGAASTAFAARCRVLIHYRTGIPGGTPDSGVFVSAEGGGLETLDPADEHGRGNDDEHDDGPDGHGADARDMDGRRHTGGA